MQVAKHIDSVLKDLKPDNTNPDTAVLERLKNVPMPSFSQYRLLKSLPARTPDEDLMLLKYEYRHLDKSVSIRRSNDQALADAQEANKPKALTPEALKIRFMQIAKAHVKGTYIVDDENRAIISYVFNYFAGLPVDDKLCRNAPTDPRKGLLLAGNFGSGKTALLDIHRQMNWHGKRFRTVSAHDIVAKFDAKGESGITPFLNTGNLFIDDLGAEAVGVHYGKREEVLKRVLEMRYILFTKEGKRTYATTNLSLQELAERYGGRVESRLYEMFNIVYLGDKADSRDFRKVRSGKR